MSDYEPTAQNAPWNEPLDERERELMDPDYWDESTTVVGKPAPNATLTIGVRLDRADVRILAAAASAANMPLSRYITQVALESAKRTKEAVPGHNATRGVA